MDGESASKAVKSADRHHADAAVAIRKTRFLQASNEFKEAWRTANAVLPSPGAPVGEPPIVSILTPASGGVLGLSSVTVTGVVHDIVAGTVNDADVSLHVNGVPAEVVNRSFLAREVPVGDGLSALVAVGTDGDGNRATSCAIVKVDIARGLRLRAISGDVQTGQIQSTLSEPLVVQVNDDTGKGVDGARVVYRVVQGNGGLGESRERSVVLHTDSRGRASSTLTLGSRVGVGVDRVRATAAIDRITLS